MVKHGNKIKGSSLLHGSDKYAFQQKFSLVNYVTKIK